MRYAKTAITWDSTEYHSIDTAITTDPTVAAEAIYYWHEGPENTFDGLYEYKGNMDRLAEILEDEPTVLDYETPASNDGLTYIHYEGSDADQQMLDLFLEHNIVIKWPVSFIEQSRAEHGMYVTFLGGDTAIRDAIGSLPDVVDVELNGIGEYTGHLSNPLSVLTDRQLDVLDIALEKDYYSTPRQTTHEEIATELDISQATVADHLQRIESKLIGSIVAERSPLEE